MAYPRFCPYPPSRSFNRTARQVVVRQLNHNMTFRVPWQKFTSLGVTKGLTLSCMQTPVRDQDLMCTPAANRVGKYAQLVKCNGTNTRTCVPRFQFCCPKMSFRNEVVWPIHLKGVVKYQCPDFP